MRVKRWRRAMLSVVLAGGAALGAAPSPVAADTFTLTVSAPVSAAVGKPFPVTGSGVDPTDQGALYLEIDEIPASFTTTCPDSYLDAGQLASSTGGDLVAFDERENFDASGAFSNPNAFTATAPGKVLFCGYTDDGATDTLATASAITTVTPAVVKPANTAKPRVKQAHNTLTCGRGSWSGSPTSFSYRWLVNGNAKAGARAPTLKVTRSLHGRSVRCAVQASNAAGSASALSAPLKVR